MKQSASLARHAMGEVDVTAMAIVCVICRRQAMIACSAQRACMEKIAR